VARKFDMHERDHQCLRVALRLKGEDRMFVERMAHENKETPAEIIMGLVGGARRAFNRILRELDRP
jgi:hypothetical protein